MAEIPRRERKFSLANSYMDPWYQPKWLHVTGSLVESGEHEFDAECESRLLVLYSGGTIGMKVDRGVYSPAPGFLGTEIRRMPMFHDPEYAMHYSEDEGEQPLVMPLSKDGKRVIYTLWEYEPLLDSSNMTMTDWARLGVDIKKNYDKFDGFVILHGTDTMAYTASALSFMLENLGKPVILTGSQIPIFETRSDGRDNFLGALIMAGHYCIPEVAIFFNNKLLRGNRTTKMDSGAFDAFKSPNMNSIADLEIDIHVSWDSIFRPPGMNKFDVHTKMCPHVGLLRLFPSITTATVRAFLQEPMKGVVIQTYGAGNGPSARLDLLEVFKEACQRGVLIVNITQCSRGSVSPAYAAGKALSDMGLIPGSDMTPEAALTKLSYILGKEELSYQDRKQMLSMNLRGEMKVVGTRGTQDEPGMVPLLELPVLARMREALRLSSTEEVKILKNAVFPSLICAAAQEGDIKALDKLQEAGANIGCADYDGRTALHVAASEGHLEVIKYLLDDGVSVHVRDRFGESPLDNAVRFNRHKAIKMLVQTGAHLTQPPFRIGTILCTAAMHEDATTLQSWFLAGAAVNQGDYDSRTALHVAAAHGFEDMVRLLLSAGARTDIYDSFGLTPLDEARKRGYHDILKVLEGISLT